MGFGTWNTMLKFLGNRKNSNVVVRGSFASALNACLDDGVAVGGATGKHGKNYGADRISTFVYDLDNLSEIRPKSWQSFQAAFGRLVAENRLPRLLVEFMQRFRVGGNQIVDEESDLEDVQAEAEAEDEDVSPASPPPVLQSDRKRAKDFDQIMIPHEAVIRSTVMRLMNLLTGEHGEHNRAQFMQFLLDVGYFTLASFPSRGSTFDIVYLPIVNELDSKQLLPRLFTKIYELEIATASDDFEKLKQNKERYEAALNRFQRYLKLEK